MLSVSVWNAAVFVFGFCFCMYIIPASFPLVAIRVSLLTMNWLVSIPFRSMHTFVTHSSVLAIFPLSYLIAPVVGLLSYSFGLLVWWRRYVNILIASLLPTVASVIIYVNYFASLSAMEMSIEDLLREESDELKKELDALKKKVASDRRQLSA